MAPINKHHQDILTQIRKHAGKGTKQTALDNYFGNTHKRYAMNSATMRAIARDWMKAHRQLTVKEFTTVLTSLIKGESSTEKLIAGILFDYATPDQRRAFDPKKVNQWLNHLVGWVEVDTLCTNKVNIKEMVSRWNEWRKLLTDLSVSKNINKRRASLVLLCAPLRKMSDDDMVTVALANIDRLKSEKDVLITKAISWLLRSMIRYNRGAVEKYLKENESSLPSIAVRETLTKLSTGRKTKAAEGK